MDIWFEAVPSPAGAGAERIASDIAKLAEARDAGAKRILVPEVVDTGHASIDSLEFAARVRQRLELPTGIAVVTASRNEETLANRIAEADAHDVDTLLLVGPSSSQEASGPSVTQALDAHATGRHIGVVTIPTRRREDLDEPERILLKQAAGARFAVTQILFDAEQALDVRRQYLAGLNGEPIPFYYSLAPVKRAADLEFLQSLGVEIPAGAIQRITAAPAEQRGAIAQDIVVELALRLAAAHERENLGPFGFCISHVLFRNVPEAIALMRRIAALPIQVPS